MTPSADFLCHYNKSMLEAFFISNEIFFLVLEAPCLVPTKLSARNEFKFTSKENFFTSRKCLERCFVKNFSDIHEDGAPS